MGKDLIAAYRITIEYFKKSLKCTPWYRFSRILYLQHELGYFRNKLKEAQEYEKEHGSK